ncbi:unnamed protein product [Cunninghamella blakesleeana]
MYLLGFVAGFFLYGTVIGEVHTIALTPYKRTETSIKNIDESKLVNLPWVDSLLRTSPSLHTTRLTSDNNILWYADIYVGTGTGRQKFTVDVDTGSSDLFIPGNHCKTHCEGHTLFDPAKSSTSKSTNNAFVLEFADKSVVKGVTYEETVEFGGLIAKNQTVGISNAYSTGMGKELFTPDGLLGLGFKTLSKFGETPLLDTLYNQGQIEDKIFGVYLNTDSEDTNTKFKGGELTIGGYNRNMVTRTPTFTSVTSEKFWQVQFDRIYVNGVPLASKKQAIIDTGSTLINTDSTFARAFYSRIRGAKKISNTHYAVPCNRIPRVFTIKPSSFSFGRVETKNGVDSNLCYGGVVGSLQPGSNTWIVGGVFLSSVYSIFDADKRQIGFSQL